MWFGSGMVTVELSGIRGRLATGGMAPRLDADLGIDTVSAFGGGRAVGHALGGADVIHVGEQGEDLVAERVVDVDAGRGAALLVGFNPLYHGECPRASSEAPRRRPSARPVRATDGGGWVVFLISLRHYTPFVGDQGIEGSFQAESVRQKPGPRSLRLTRSGPPS